MKPSVTQQNDIVSFALANNADGLRVYEDGWVSCNVPAYNSSNATDFDENFFIPIYYFQTEKIGAKVQAGFSFLQFWKMPDAANVERKYFEDPEREWAGNGSARYVTLNNQDLPQPFDEKFYYYLTRQGDAGGFDPGNFSGGGGYEPQLAVIADTGLIVYNELAQGIQQSFQGGNFIDKGQNRPYNPALPNPQSPITWGSDFSAAAINRIETDLQGTVGVDIQFVDYDLTFNQSITPNTEPAPEPNLTLLQGKGLPMPDYISKVDSAQHGSADIAYRPIFSWRNRQRILVEYDGGGFQILPSTDPELKSTFPVNATVFGFSPFSFVLQINNNIGLEYESIEVIQVRGGGATAAAPNITSVDLAFNEITISPGKSTGAQAGDVWQVTLSSFYKQPTNFYPDYEGFRNEPGIPPGNINLGFISVRAYFQKI